MVRPPGFEPGSSAWEFSKSLSVNWLENKEDFLNWLKSRRFHPRYVKGILSYLRRFMRPIGGPRDVIAIFANLTSGQQHHMDRALRAYLNFLEDSGVNVDFLNLLRKAIPKDRTGIDIRIPSEDEVVASLRKIGNAMIKYQALYSLLIDSGLRLVEAVKMINDGEDIQKVNGFYRCSLGYFRGSKTAYFAYFTEATLRLIGKAKEELKDQSATTYYRKHGCTAPKYLRKYAFDKMIQLDIPESIADFIQGRVPTRIGAKHYMALARQADQKYGRYAEYITRLRQKTLT